MAGYHVLNNELVWISYITKPYETIRIIPFSTSLHKGPMFSRSMASNMALNTGLERAVALGATFSALACGSAPWVWLFISFPSIFAIERCFSVTYTLYNVRLFVYILRPQSSYCTTKPITVLSQVPAGSISQALLYASGVDMVWWIWIVAKRAPQRIGHVMIELLVNI